MGQMVSCTIEAYSISSIITHAYVIYLDDLLAKNSIKVE